MLLDWAVCCHGGKVEPGDIGDSSAGVKSLRLADDCRWRVLVGVVDVLRDAARLPGCLGGATVVTLNLPSPSFLPMLYRRVCFSTFSNGVVAPFRRKLMMICPDLISTGATREGFMIQ